MLQECLSALRSQIWPTYAGGAMYHMAFRTARRKHLRIAARKKRELENKLKAKEKVVEKTFVPYKVRLMQAAGPKVHLDDLLKARFKDSPEDDVWLQKYYMKRVCSFSEALQYHREAFHPTVLNAPDSPVHLDVELNMKMEKTRFMEKATGIVYFPHMEDDRVKRSVVACCKSEEDQAKAREAGAELVGATEVVTAIEKGSVKVDDFAYLVCHQDFILDLLKLRGVLAKKFPDKKKGTLGTDMAAMVKHFAKGIEFSSTKEFGVHLYANVNVAIGRLDMPDQHLLENCEALVRAILPIKSADLGPLINKCLMKVPGSNEEFVVDLQPFISKVEPAKKAKKVKHGKGVQQKPVDDTVPVEEAKEALPVHQRAELAAAVASA